MVFRRFHLLKRQPARLRRALRAPALLLPVLLNAHAADAKVDDSLALLQRVAVARAGLSAGSTTSLLARQHLAALLPQVRVTLGRGWQLSSNGQVLDGLTSPTVDNDHTSYAVSASWDLSRLIAPREALQIQHEEPRRVRQRLAVQVRVARLISARCVLLQIEAPSASQQGQVAELEAALDLLTGGQPLPAVNQTTNCPAAPRFGISTLPRATRRPAARSIDETTAPPELDLDDNEPGFDE